MSKKILIVKPSSLGDIIHSLATLNAIKKAGEYTVDWVVASGFEGLLDGHPMIRHLWIIKKQQWRSLVGAWRFPRDIFLLSRRLREERYDIVIDLQGLFRSGLITFLSGAHLRVGFSDAREKSSIFYNKKLPGGKDIHAVERYLKLLRLIGIDPDEIHFPMPPTKGSISVNGPYYIVVPGARWQSKRWLPEYFGETIYLLSKSIPELKALLVGSKEDVSISEEVKAYSRADCIDLTGRTTLKQLMQLIKGASFVVTNDSGPMHLAAAYGVPVFAIFGPTDENLTGPYGQLHNVLRAKISCAPCFRRSCKHITCMREVSPEMVMERIQSLQNSVSS
jgi:heptosyltransferase-1